MRFAFLPLRCKSQAWAFSVSCECEFIFCMFRMMFAISDHVLLLHVAFSSAMVCACSGVRGSFWLILCYMFLVCMSFCILLFPAGSRWSCVAFSRSCIMSKFMCLLMGTCLFVRIMSYFMSIFVVSCCNVLLGLQTPLV